MNPFNPNSVVRPRLFAGRSKQVMAICKKLSQLQHDMSSSFFIHGERGIGKTALAKLISYVAAAKDPDLDNLDLLTGYYAVEEGQDIGGVLQEAINQLTDTMDKTVTDKIGERVGTLFKNGKFTIGAFGAELGIEAGANANKQQMDVTIKDQSVSILSNMVKVIREQGHQGVLFVIDEVHNLNDISRAASIIRNITTTLDFQSLGAISFLFIGYDEDVDQFFSRDRSARRTFDLYKLDVMPDEDAKQVLTKGFEDAKLKWSDEALDANIGLAGGYPHSIQMIGHYLVEADKDGVVDKDDWLDATFETAYALRTKEFSSMFAFDAKLRDRDRLLQELARRNTPLNRQQLSKHLSGKNVYKLIKELKKQGAIKEDEDKNLHLQSQLFRTAITIDGFIRASRENKKQEKAPEAPKKP